MVTDIRVVQRGRSPRLANETAFPLGVSQLRVSQNLQGDEAVQVRVAGLVNHTHPPLTDFFGDLVMCDGPTRHVERFHR